MSNLATSPSTLESPPRRRARPDLTKPGATLTAAPFPVPAVTLPIPSPVAVPAGAMSPGLRSPGTLPAAFAGQRVFDPRTKRQAETPKPVAAPVPETASPVAPAAVPPAPPARASTLTPFARGASPGVGIRKPVLSKLGGTSAETAEMPTLDQEVFQAPAAPALPVINLTAPLPTEAEVARGAKAAATHAPENDAAAESVATLMQETSKKPALILAVARVGKWWATVPLLLIGAFYLTKTILLPLAQEMRNPTKGGEVDRSASTAVQVIQQTRKVVAANNDKVDKLNDVVLAMEQPAPPVASPPVRAAAPAPATAAPAISSEERLSRVQQSLAGMKFSGVIGGSEPRMVLDGRLIKFGDVVDYGLGLRLVEIDDHEHEMYFVDSTRTLYRRRY